MPDSVNPDRSKPTTQSTTQTDPELLERQRDYEDEDFTKIAEMEGFKLLTGSQNPGNKYSVVVQTVWRDSGKVESEETFTAVEGHCTVFEIVGVKKYRLSMIATDKDDLSLCALMPHYVCDAGNNLYGPSGATVGVNRSGPMPVNFEAGKPYVVETGKSHVGVRPPFVFHISVTKISTPATTTAPAK